MLVLDLFPRRVAAMHRRLRLGLVGERLVRRHPERVEVHSNHELRVARADHQPRPLVQGKAECGHLFVTPYRDNPLRSLQPGGRVGLGRPTCCCGAVPPSMAWKPATAEYNRRMTNTRQRGQSLAEFALVMPLFMLLLGAMIQGGIYFWATNTLSQVTRDTLRWGESETSCNPAKVVAQANKIAARSGGLIGYAANSWTATDVVVAYPPNPLDPTAPCPPEDPRRPRSIEVTIHHTIPMFFPPFSADISAGASGNMEPRP